MAQLHFYIPDSVADSVKVKAEHAHFPYLNILQNW